MKQLISAAVTSERGRRVDRIVIVLDNARAHLDIELRDFSEVDGGKEIIFLKLAPYSYLLNPIEMAWSQVKATIKRELKDKMRELESPPTELTQREHKLRVMESIIDNAVAPPHCPDSFQATGSISQVSRYYDKCFANEDLREIGQ